RAKTQAPAETLPGSGTGSEPGRGIQKAVLIVPAPESLRRWPPDLEWLPDRRLLPSGARPHSAVRPLYFGAKVHAVHCNAGQASMMLPGRLVQALARAAARR